MGVVRIDALRQERRAPRPTAAPRRPRFAAGQRPQRPAQAPSQGWLITAVVLTLTGVAGSLLGASSVAGDDHQRARSAFASSAAQIAATLTLAIQHEEDLVVSARAFIVGRPYSSEAAFRRWITAEEALSRYPELEGGGEVVLVPRAQLRPFLASHSAEPTAPLAPGRSFEVVPPGSRPFYCLVSLSFNRTVNPTTAVPAGLDYCAIPSSLRTAFLTARDSGANAYLLYHSGQADVLVVETPVYRGGVVPSTVAARRRAFLGAFGTTVLPRVVLTTALRGHSGFAVELRKDSGSVTVAFRNGAQHRGDRSASIDLHYGWEMSAFAAPASSGLLADSRAITLLGGGFGLSVLLGLLVFVLGTGRARAYAMVRQKTSEISHQALHDALTGLPNRALVLDRAERMLTRAKRNPKLLPAALYIDIDRFKYVNDTFGHAAGDELLRTVAQRLLGVVRDQDTVGRLGGDEFVVLLESATHEAPPDLVAERVVEVMHEPVVLDGGETSLTCSVSIGVAVGPRASADELVRDADLALYTAKAAGKNRAVLFQASMQSTAEDRLRLESDLEVAVLEGQFFLLYQPILDLQSRGVVGVEALIRWRHPQRGIVLPEDFIPIAEETGRILSIGRWVIDEACGQAAAWDAQGHHMGMSLNVSAYQLDRDGFAEDVHRALEQSGIEPGSLTLEITETALMRDVEAAAERLTEIKALGVRIAIDDFGTGSSSLAYLRQFSADSLKIDRSFISGITDSKESAAIIHTLVELGKLLEIETLAEGIEESDQLSQLQREHCDQGQGFLFARPLDASGIERFLARSPVGEAATLL
jgi:diguanylate cyclase (GGDEF)-like protein